MVTVGNWARTADMASCCRPDQRRTIRTVAETQKATAKHGFGNKKSLGWGAMLKCSMFTNHNTTHRTNSQLNTRMPIPEQVLKPEPQLNDLGHDVSKYKRDATHFRAPWLDHAVPSGGSTYTRIIVRVVVSVLAVYGLYSIFF